MLQLLDPFDEKSWLRYLSFVWKSKHEVFYLDTFDWNWIDGRINDSIFIRVKVSKISSAGWLAWSICVKKNESHASSKCLWISNEPFFVGVKEVIAGIIPYGIFSIKWSPIVFSIDQIIRFVINSLGVALVFLQFTSIDCNSYYRAT